MTQNISDATLKLHNHLVDTFIELMTEGDEEVTSDDIESTKDIVDIIVEVLDLQVVAVEGNTLTLSVTLPDDTQ